MRFVQDCNKSPSALLENSIKLAVKAALGRLDEYLNIRRKNLERTSDIVIDLENGRC